MPIITISDKILTYSDGSITPASQPLRKNFDWSRTVTIECSNPRSQSVVIPPGNSYNFFSGTQPTSIDGTTAFTVTKNPIYLNRYRFTTVAGTLPQFRTDRGLTLNTATLTVVVNSDLTAFLDLTGGTWASVLAGDTVFIPGPVTGDGASPVSSPNQGFWNVIAVISPTRIQVERRSSFDASAEAVVLTSNSQVTAFSSSGVQIGDKTFISSGFSAQTLGFYTITEVTPTWFEIESTYAIPQEVAIIPTALGIVFYTNGKKFLYIETDQLIAVRINGDLTNNNTASPIEPGDRESPGWIRRWGPCWSLTAVNLSVKPVNVSLFTVE